MAADPDSQRKVIKSAARVIQVLEFFDEKKRALSVADIAAEHDWPHSSTSALMASLVTLGYLHYDASHRTYLPTMRVALLGDWVQDDSFKDGQLMRLMQHMTDVTGEVIVLAAQNGLHSQYLRVVEGTHPLRLHLYIGMLRPLFGSGTGRMLLAQMDDATITKLARKSNATVEGDTRIDIATVLAQVARDRAAGSALSVNQVTPGGSLLAMAVPMVAGVKPLVLGISGFTERLVANEQAYADAMREGMKRFLVE